MNNLPQGGTYLAGASFDSPPTPATSLYIIDGYPGVDMQKYNMATDVWVSRNAIPTGRASSTGGTAVSAVGATRIYALGYGYTPYPVNGKINEQYTIATDTWTSRRSMPTGRSAPGAAAQGNSVFVVGGAVPSFANDLEIYNAATDAWATGMQRAHIAATAHVAGPVSVSPKLGAGLVLCRVILSIRVLSRKRQHVWCELLSSAMCAGNAMPSPRMTMATAVAGSFVFVAGGTPGPFTGDVFEMYSIQSDIWKTGTLAARD